MPLTNVGTRNARVYMETVDGNVTELGLVKGIKALSTLEKDSVNITITPNGGIEYRPFVKNVMSSWNVTIGSATMKGEARKKSLIERVIIKDPAVIIFWKDGDKTVSVAGKGDEFDAEFGFLLAVAKKMFGTYENYMFYLNKSLKKNNLTTKVVGNVEQ